MAASDMAAGYPVHAVESYGTRVTQHDVTITDWTATCGATGQQIGRGRLGTAGSARKAELCKTFWPNDHATFHPKPINTSP